MSHAGLDCFQRSCSGYWRQLVVRGNREIISSPNTGRGVGPATPITRITDNLTFANHHSPHALLLVTLNLVLPMSHFGRRIDTLFVILWKWDSLADVQKLTNVVFKSFWNSRHFQRYVLRPWLHFGQGRIWWEKNSHRRQNKSKRISKIGEAREVVGKETKTTDAGWKSFCF